MRVWALRSISNNRQLGHTGRKDLKTLNSAGIMREGNIRMRPSAFGALAFGCVLALATTVGAETIKYEVKDDAIKASLTGKAGDAGNGKKVFLNRKKETAWPATWFPV